jgi:hypothetical protein
MYEIDNDVIEKINDITENVKNISNRLNSLSHTEITQLLKNINTKFDDLSNFLKDYFVVMSGATVDLASGKKVRDFSAIERVFRVSDYLEYTIGDVFKKFKDIGCPQPDSIYLNVIIEHQMGPNAISGTSADLTINYFKRANVAEIGAGFKNKVRISNRPDLDHSRYIAKYKTNKSANKNHTKTLYFDLICPLFGHKNFVVPTNKRDDFADCIIQIIGCRKFADYNLLKTKF